MKRWILLLFPLFLFGKEVWTDPYFTGPLLAPSASVNAFRQVTWQPYLFVTNNYGAFDDNWKRTNTPDLWAIQPLVDVTYGIGSFMDLEAIPAFVIQTSQGSTSIRMNDTPLILGIQALRQEMGTWRPDLRIILKEVFPFGQYEKLNPKKNGTDSSGKGSFQSVLGFAFEKTFQTGVEHYFRLRWTAEATLYPSSVHVKGINAYGGAPDTDGTVRPGRLYIFYLSGEYTITHNWGFAFDTEYLITSSDDFSGKRGTNDDGTRATVGSPTSVQINCAPAIEYNFSENFGVIGGAYFTLFGKNTSAFYSGVISAVITY